MNKNESSQTAYQNNAHSLSITLAENDHGWAEPINRMIDQRYAFLALQYESEGYLFRGMSSGLFDALLEDQFWHYPSNDSGNHFEKELNVLLLSQDLSDAYSISKLWEKKPDSCIVIFRSEIFNRALNEKKAAMMATAEPGIVFKYPFLSHPLGIEDIDYLIVSPQIVDLIENNKNSARFSEIQDLDFNKISLRLSELYNAGKLLMPDFNMEDNGRSVLEKKLVAHLLENAVFGAQSVTSAIKPARKI
ncbi:MAG: hypothetical protein HND53_07990 [Proteobacteria bacterium]|nr:hypothetical protein [Pseudomonadota bacterium]NOG60423.1 hypothetical protein [Pseudomonadota bacterium]